MLLSVHSNTPKKFQLIFRPLSCSVMEKERTPSLTHPILHVLLILHRIDKVLSYESIVMEE